MNRKMTLEELHDQIMDIAWDGVELGPMLDVVETAVAFINTPPPLHKSPGSPEANLLWSQQDLRLKKDLQKAVSRLTKVLA